MKKHTKIYMDALGLSPGEFICSELWPHKEATDVHHILGRGMGGTEEEDRIETLMALTREEHIEYGDKKKWMKYLLSHHMLFLEANGVKYDPFYMYKLIEQYA